ncbi:hypothetical protein ACMFMG_011773 [Clarireedia jacksonii]
MSLPPRLQEWILLFNSHVSDEKDIDDKYIRETSLEITSELEYIINFMLLSVPYDDWVDSLRCSPPEFIRCAKAFIEAVNCCREVRLSVTGYIAATKIKQLQRNLVGCNPFGCWIVAEREDTFDPFRPFVVLREQYTPAIHQQLCEIYASMCRLKRIDWNHFLEPQAPASNKCITVLIENRFHPWDVKVKAKICDLEKDKSAFRDNPRFQGVWSSLVEGGKVPRKFKHFSPDDEVLLILRLNIWESSYLELLQSSGPERSLCLQWLSIALWSGKTSASFQSCLQSVLEIVNDRSDEKIEFGVSKDDGLRYPFALYGFMQALETELCAERPMYHLAKMLLVVLSPVWATQWI